MSTIILFKPKENVMGVHKESHILFTEVHDVVIQW